MGTPPPAAAPAPIVHVDLPDYDSLSTVDAQHYVIGDAISSGGMGRVVSARDRRLGRTVAIKELLPRNRENDLVVARDEVRPQLAVGAAFAMHKLPIGSPVWDVAGATLYRTRVGTNAAGNQANVVETKQILPNHSFVQYVWHSTTPHPPPYGSEAAEGVARVGLPSGTRFTIADWAR